MAPRIALNAALLSSPVTGIGTYVVELARAIANGSRVDLYCFRGMRWTRGLATDPSSERGPKLAFAIRERARRWVPFKRSLRQLQQQIAFGAGMRRHGIALYHEPNYVPIRYDVPVVVTAHDLSWDRFPEMHPDDRVRWLERGFAVALERASAIIVDSRFIAEELTARFGVSGGRLHVVPLGVGAAFRPRTADETRASLAALSLVHGSYVLSVGTIEPRKNLEHVLAAYALLPGPLRERFPMVIAGAHGWKSESMEGRLRDLHAAGRVRFLGPVSPRLLPQLYSGAAAFVYPSLYEGFGLPPLEAMASGVPVLAADRAAIPEVVGDAGILVDPGCPEQTARGLESVLEDASRAGEMRAHGIARARMFSWEACAAATVDVYAKVLH